MTHCVQTQAAGARGPTNVSPVGTTAETAHVWAAVIFTQGQWMHVCVGILIDVVCGLSIYILSMYFFVYCVPRALREFAGPDGECVACHPECKPQSGKASCTGLVIISFDCTHS